jgi:thiamine-phosphate pyrophosphorylase
MKRPIGRLQVLTDDTVQDRFSHQELARLAILGGADTIQFREKRRGTREAIAIAAAVQSVCAGFGVTFIVNDRADIALAVGADGVHLGREDLPVHAARDILGPDKIIGGTAGNLQEAMQAERDGADYVGFGHIYATRSKKKRVRPKGPESLVDLCRTVEIPVIAIGGINAHNLGPVMESGAWGVAVIEAVAAHADPQRASKTLADIIGRFRPPQ